ncbi:hypothetical protein, partial [Enterobacter hormaechei]|uniref:hypothetical protein n=1 Tax=Enterobacter hormaechei TaxID=158836 RepID=UPI00203E456F
VRVVPESQPAGRRGANHEGQAERSPEEAERALGSQPHATGRRCDALLSHREPIQRYLELPGCDGAVCIGGDAPAVGRC